MSNEKAKRQAEEQAEDTAKRSDEPGNHDAVEQGKRQPDEDAVNDVKKDADLPTAVTEPEEKAKREEDQKAAEVSTPTFSVIL